ncbi:oxygenase MpaB family protein [soil metagenome]
MTEPVLPSEEEAEGLVLGPDSLSWNVLGDARIYLAAGFALILQVAHPTVGSGVRDHSTFQQDPWGRLLRTMDYLNLLAYGGSEAVAVGRRLRELHKPIKGTNADGSRYHALEPQAYAWVHATLIEGAVAAHTRFIGPLSPARVERLYAEYMPLGRLVGVRERDMPPDWASFRAYFDETVANTLERNETVDTVLASLAKPSPPPLPVPGFDQLWKLLRVPPAEAISVATVGLMGEATRAKLGLGFSPREQVELRALGRASRALTRVLPRDLRVMGPAYLRRRREAIAAGPLGSG